MSANNMRYEVRPIADENCDRVTDTLLLSTDSLEEAKAMATLADYPYGAGIVDTESQEIDVGFGFGVPAPDPA